MDIDDYFYDATTAWCDQVNPFLRRVNSLIISQSVAGGVALLLCTASVFHVVAHGKYKRSPSSRLALCVLSNIIYAITDMHHLEKAEPPVRATLR